MAFLAIVSGLFWFLRTQKVSAPDNSAVLALESGKSNISAIIVPHHDLVMTQRQDVLKAASQAENDYKTIILVSPNHFAAGNNGIAISGRQWRMGENLIDSDAGVVNALTQNGYAVDEAAFENEHGIKNVLTDLPNYYSNFKIVAIDIKQSVTREAVDKFGDDLQKSCTDKCLIIASVDFSHYQPSALAELHDSLSIRALKNMDLDLIWRSEVDSPQSLAIAVSWAKSQGTDCFNLQDNTNSGKINKDRDAESTSYVLGWYEDGGQKLVADEATFLFGGDMMFDRGVDYYYRENNLYKVMEKFGERVFWGTDLAFANLEGPISSEPIPIDTTAGNMSFNFPPLTTNVLSWLHINAVGLANNHTNNNGKSGFTNTLRVLENAGISSVGQEVGFSDSSVRRFISGDQVISVIAVNILEMDQNLSVTIKSEKAAGAFVVVFPHWGIEYDQVHNSAQEKLAHDWINAGADLVIGSHPHVMQDAEMYQGKPIFYSLGNLLFDQTFSKETQRGLLVGGKVKAGKLVELVILPTLSQKIQPALMQGGEKTEIIKQLREGLGLNKVEESFGYDTIKL